MITTTVGMDGVRGDSLERAVFLFYQGRAMTAAEGTQLAAQFTRLDFQIRADPDSTTVLAGGNSAEGALEWGAAINPKGDANTPQACILLHIPATRMAGVDWDGFNDLPQYDLQLTEPRPGNYLGDLVWTIASGSFTPRKDVTRVA